MKKEIRKIDWCDQLALMVNIFLIMGETTGFVLRIIIQNDPGFAFYTMDSNLLSLIASVIFVYYFMRGRKLPHWASVLKFTSVIALMVTFIVVLTVLSPGMENGYVTMMFSGQMLFTHTVCPVLATLSFLLLERHHLVSKDVMWATMYTVIYAIILVIMNLARVIEGPYPFLMVYNQSIMETIGWTVTILGGAIGLAFLLKNMRKFKV